jgi:Protein of unknown function (DUF1566)
MSMGIRSGLVGGALIALVLAIMPGIAQAQGRGAAPPSPAGRFVDNGDDTITDTMTGLMWEKKTTAVGSGPSAMDVRDVDNRFTWEYAMNDYVDRLNGRLIAFATDGAFARRTDWRIPTMQELQTIVEPSAPGRMHAAFGPNAPASYWTSSRRLLGPTAVPWYVSPSASTSGRFATRAESRATVATR